MNEVIRLSNVECRDCYKCIRNCPVKAIKYSDGRAEIIPSDCVVCGDCVVTCPQRGDFVLNCTSQVRAAIESGKKVVASVAPSFISELPVGSIEGMRETLRGLGFADAQESAIGVEVVCREYERIKRAGRMETLISSCCSSVVSLIRRYYPDLLPYLAPVKSPMQVHCAMLKEEDPEAVTVFIGSCYAKKQEAIGSDSVDFVMTFEEIKDWMNAADVKPVYLPSQEKHGKRARRYPRQDGLVKAMTPVEGWNRVAIDGLNDCIAALNEIRHGGVTHTFLEMTACEGSCVNGPAGRTNQYEHRIRGTVAVNQYAGSDDYGVTTNVSLEQVYTPETVVHTEPSEDEIQKILRVLGKDASSAHLNCGCCGYTTCRQMAVAICTGMAQMDMCLPYLRERAESHSKEIIESTLVTADRLIDKQMRAAQEIASLLGESTAETKLVLTKLKEAVQSDE